MFIYKVVTSMDYPVEGNVLAKRRNKELKDMQKAYCKDDNKVIRELKIPLDLSIICQMTHSYLSQALNLMIAQIFSFKI